MVFHGNAMMKSNFLIQILQFPFGLKLKQQESKPKDLFIVEFFNKKVVGGL